MPKVSIIITSYNYAQYLKDTVNSVLNQTFKDWELIIIDDNSTDNSVEIITEFVNSDTRIRLIKNHENQGLSKSVQIGLMSAMGKWIAFLESDDLWKENYLEKKLEISEKHSECGILYNNVEFFDINADTAKQKYTSIIRKNNKIKNPYDIFYHFGYRNLIFTMSSVMIERKLFEGIDFNTPIDKLLDWYLYIQIARKTYAYYLNEDLTLWRQHSDSYLTKKNGLKFKFVNVSAYFHVWKQEPWNLKLLLFIIIVTNRMCFKRILFYLIKQSRRSS